MNLIKKSLIIIAMLLISINTFAYDFEVDGICFNAVSPTELTCQVTYKDLNYNSYSGEIIIPETVPFQNKTLTVTSIGANAFNSCSNLVSIKLPQSISSIGSDAFSECSNLSDVFISDLSSWCKISFRNKTSNPMYYAKNIKLNGNEITELVIPNDITQISDFAFYNWDKLGIVSIPNSTTTIGNFAFYNCSQLQSITIPSSVTSIGDSTFYNCSNLAELTITNSSKTLSIGNNSFANCPMKSVYLGRDINNTPFKNMTTLHKMTISNNVTSIPRFAFYGCTSLASINLPNSITKIGDSAFERCTSLTSFVIPDSVTELGIKSFKDCKSLEEFTIGSGITTLPDDLIYNCSKIKKLIIKDSPEQLNVPLKKTSQYWLWVEGLNNEATWYVYRGYFSDIPTEYVYMGRDIVSESETNSYTENYINYDITYLSEPPFSRNSNIKTFLIGSNVTSLPDLKVVNCEPIYFFKSLINLAEIHSFNPNPPNLSEHSFDRYHYLNTPVYIPIGSLSSYQSAVGWKNFWNISEAGIESTMCDDDISLTIKNGNIIIDNINNPHVEVYNINGQIVYNGNSTIIPISENGLYIIKINNKSYKVIL